MANKNVMVNVDVNFRNNLQEVIDKINALKHSIKQMESGDKEVDADIYEENVKALHDLTSQYNEYKKGITGAEDSNNEFINSLSVMVQTGNISAGAIKSLVSKLGPYGAAILAVVGAYNALDKVMDSFIADAKAAGGVVSDTLVSSYQGFINVCEELADKVQYLNDKLLDAVEVGITSQQGYFTLFNYLGEEVGEDIVVFTDSLEKFYNIDASSLIGDMRGMLAVVSNMNLSAEDITKYSKALTTFTQDLSAFSGRTREEITSQLEAAINMNVLNSRSALARALDLTDREIEQFKVLNTQEERAQYLLSKGTVIRGTYNKYLQTSAGKVEQLNQQYSSLINNVGMVALGLYAKVAPLLTKLINLANTLVSAIAKLFNVNLKTGAENMASNTDMISSGFENIADKADKAYKAERKVLEFDDVIQINENNSSGSGSGVGAGIGDLDWSTWLDDIDDANKELSDFEKMLERVQKHMESGEFYEAGREIITFFKDFLNDIDWDGIQDKVGEFGVGLAQFFNGLLSDRNAYMAIGKTLAELLNTGMTLLYDFAKEFDFKQLGIDLAGAWTSFWSNLDSKLFADTVYEWFSGIFEGGSNFIDRVLSSFTLVVNKEGNVEMLNGFENIGYKIADSINEFFSNLTDEDLDNIVNTFIGFIDGIFQAIGTFIETVDIEMIKEKIQDLFNRIGKSMGENAEEWGTVAHDLIMGLLDMLQFMLQTAETSGIITAINEFIESLGLDEILKEWIELKLMSMIGKLRVKLPAIFDMLWGIIKTLVFPLANSFMDDLWIFVLSLVDIFFGNMGEKIATGIEKIGTFIKNNDGLKKAWEEWIKKIYTKIAEWVTKILEKLNILKNDEGLIGKWAKIGNYFGNRGKEKEQKESTTFNLNRPSGINVPMLASGGIANHATLAVIGEAGKEAVLPLENNTEWMDAIATKVAGLMRNSGGGINSSITLDMSSISKPYYSRSEMMEFGKTVVEALKLYGVKVSLTY